MDFAITQQTLIVALALMDGVDLIVQLQDVPSAMHGLTNLVKPHFPQCRLTISQSVQMRDIVTARLVCATANWVSLDRPVK